MTRVMIGQTIASEEEYIGEDNTFVNDEGEIKASVIGEILKDEEEKTIKVKGKVGKLQINDKVYAEVSDVKPKMMLVNIIKITNRDETENKPTTNKMAALHMNNVSREFIDRLRDVAKIGDIIRAEIYQLNNGMIDLSTKFKGLGVVSAYCSRCRTKLRIKERDRKNKDLTVMQCPRCKNKETRKVAFKYM